MTAIIQVWYPFLDNLWRSCTADKINFFHDELNHFVNVSYGYNLYFRNVKDLFKPNIHAHTIKIPTHTVSEKIVNSESAIATSYIKVEKWIRIRNASDIISITCKHSTLFCSTLLWIVGNTAVSFAIRELYTQPASSNYTHVQYISTLNVEFYYTIYPFRSQNPFYY